MNNFHDILLPEFMNIHIKGGPIFATNHASSISSREIRMPHREYAIQKYTLSNARLSTEQFQQFNCFFRARKGMYHSFRIKDYADFRLENQIIGTGDDKILYFEIFKKYNDDISSYFRRIITIRPNTFTSNIMVKNIDYINGIIELGQYLLMNENLIINAEFDVAVRFCSDEFTYSFCQDGSVLIDELELQEVLL